jgi:putative SbcD/Mre11-related phosphoesterase
MKKISNGPELNAHPIHNEPAFLIEGMDGRDIPGNVMAIADIHLGIEQSIADAGAHLPSQTNRTIERIIALCKKHSVTELILVGDVKHKVPGTSRQEWHELPEVFEQLVDVVHLVHIIPGNHDGGLRRIIPEKLDNIKLYPHSGAIIFGFGFFHGHTWPEESVLRSTTILMAHNHPHVLFVDRLGGRASYPCWVRGRLNTKRALDRYPKLDEDQLPEHEVIIMPAFNDLGSGTPVNNKKPEFLGPMLKNRYIDTGNAEIYLLDGTALGRLRDLYELNQDKDITKRRFKKFSRTIIK